MCGAHTLPQRAPQLALTLTHHYAQQLILRAINSSRSGYMAITFTKTFFDHYTLHELPVVQAGLLTKVGDGVGGYGGVGGRACTPTTTTNTQHLLAVFRTQRIVQLDMHINPEHASTSVTIKCENGALMC